MKGLLVLISYGPARTIAQGARPLLAIISHQPLVLRQNLREMLRRPLRLLLRRELLLPQLLLTERLRIRVQPQQHLPITQRVLLLHARTLGLRIALGGPHHGLHLGAVDQAADVRVGDDVRGEQEVFLEAAG